MMQTLIGSFVRVPWLWIIYPVWTTLRPLSLSGQGGTWNTGKDTVLILLPTVYCPFPEPTKSPFCGLRAGTW